MGIYRWADSSSVHGAGVVHNAGMPIPAVIAAAIAAIVHVWFFGLESLLFERPTVFRRFGLRSAEDAAIVRPMAFNQGFYNLFLAAGITGGLLLIAGGQETAGHAIVLYACACMWVPGSCSWRRTVAFWPLPHCRPARPSSRSSPPSSCRRRQGRTDAVPLERRLGGPGWPRTIVP